jgi:hypothetical protein
MPLPNKWTFEGITGLVVDKNDVIWVLQRPGDYDIDPIFRIPEKTENYASLNPPTANCCLKPEAVLAFDQQGNLLKHWNQADNVAGHLILADNAGNIWVGSDTMRKYDQDGKVLATMPRVAAPDPKAGDFPADTPMIVGRVEGGYFDEAAREIYITDSYLRGRVLVFNMDTMAFKRGLGGLWQAAEGHPDRRSGAEIRSQSAAGEGLHRPSDGRRLERRLRLRRRPASRSHPGLPEGRQIRPRVHRGTRNAGSRFDGRHGVLARSAVHLCLGHHEQRDLDREPRRRPHAWPFQLLRPQRRRAALGAHGGDRFTRQRLYGRGRHRKARAAFPGRSVSGVEG